MGAIADAFVAYAQPLLDQTDGSQEQLNKAFAMGQMFYNLALLPEDQRETTLREMQPQLKMDDEEFEQFLRDLVIPMIRRHEEMFPFLHHRDTVTFSQSDLSALAKPRETGRSEAYPGTDRYAPCPCNSGEKYKFCCGKKRR